MNGMYKNWQKEFFNTIFCTIYSDFDFVILFIPTGQTIEINAEQKKIHSLTYVCRKKIQSEKYESLC
jgi:hypothetical protein